jgi:hypothetical protein
MKNKSIKFCLMAIILTSNLAMAGEQEDWAKDPETGCEIHNKGHAQKVTWSGACVAGKANGQGTAVAETTYAGATEFTIVRTFKGEMLNGKANGYGEFVDDRERSLFVDDFEDYFADYDEGSSYKGTFINGNLDKGVLVMGDKRYEGNFVNNRLEGKGTLTYKNKDHYEGNFVGGQISNPNGSDGVFTFANGDTYKGEFDMDVFHGFGTTADAKGNVIYSGQWVHGQTEAASNANRASLRAYEASGGPARHEAYEAEKHARKMQEIDNERAARYGPGCRPIFQNNQQIGQQCN